VNVIITGAGGFIGFHLVQDQLSKGRRVTAVDLNLSRLEPLDAGDALVIVEGDFRDKELVDPHLKGQDACFHLASMHLQTSASEQDFRAINVHGTEALVRRCHRAGIGRFVHCSSVGIYGQTGGDSANENTKPAPNIAYERTKLAGEEAVLAYAAQTGFPSVVIRPAWVYGPGCPRTLKLFRSVAKGTFFYVGNGANLRHPIYIEDMLAGFELAATHSAAVGEDFIMAGPKAVTIRELIEMIAELLGRRPPRLRLPRTVTWIGALTIEKGFAAVGRDAPFSTRSLKFFEENTHFSTEKARNILGFNPVVDLKAGLARTLASLDAIS